MKARDFISSWMTFSFQQLYTLVRPTFKRTLQEGSRLNSAFIQSKPEVGFHPITQQRVYFHGHERGDIVDQSQQNLHHLKEIDEDSSTPVREYHDESTYFSNVDEGWYWGADDSRVISPKSLARVLHNGE